MPWESDEQALQREVTEETGLQLTAIEPVLRYHSAVDIACNISAFRGQAAGQLRGSWEGDPEWVAISDLRTHLLKSQLPIIERVLSAGAV